MNKKVRAVLSLVMAFSIGMIFYGTAEQATQNNELYVSPAGNDKNAGSKKKPLKTIQQAVHLAKPGTTVYIRKGNYNEQVVTRKSVLKDVPITIKAYPKEKAVIDENGLKVSWD